MEKREERPKSSRDPYARESEYGTRLPKSRDVGITPAGAFKEKSQRSHERTQMSSESQTDSGAAADATLPPLSNSINSSVNSSLEAVTGTFGIYKDNDRPPDSLGYDEYAAALASVMTDQDTKTPLTVGICAPWGRGKTALMHMIETRAEGSESLWFDAWQYSRADQIHAGFMNVVLRQIESKLSRSQKFRLACWLNRREITSILWKGLAFLAILELSALLVWSLLGRDSLQGSIVETLGIFALPGVGLTLAVGLYKSVVGGAMRVLRNPATSRIAKLVSLPDYRERLDPVHTIVEDVKTIVSYYRAKSKVNRFIVFIDDIDRCAPDKIMEVLEAAKHFMEIDGFVFVIAMDARVVRLAVGQHYAFMSDNRHEIEDMGRFYLEKLITVPFHLPDLTPDQLKVLNKDTLGPLLGTQPNDDVRDAQPATKEAQLPRVRILPEEYRTIDEVISTAGFTMSPRLFKRFVNIYLIARHLLILQSGKTSERAAPAPTTCFVKWLALSVRYPFESVALNRWLVENNWASPFNTVFSETGRFILKNSEGVPHRGSPFEHLAVDTLDEFGQVLWKLQIQIPNIEATAHIANCFSLVLD